MLMKQVLCYQKIVAWRLLKKKWDFNTDLQKYKHEVIAEGLKVWVQDKGPRATSTNY